MNIFAQNSPGTWHQLLNDSALAAFAVFVGLIVWRHVLPLVKRHIESAIELHDALMAGEGERQEQRRRQTAILDNMQTMMQAGDQRIMSIADCGEQQRKQMVKAITVAEANQADLKRFKRMVKQACAMCRNVTAAEWPQAAELVAKHCDEIERIVDTETERG